MIGRRYTKYNKKQKKRKIKNYEKGNKEKGTIE